MRQVTAPLGPVARMQERLAVELEASQRQTALEQGQGTGHLEARQLLPKLCPVVLQLGCLAEEPRTSAVALEEMRCLALA